MQSSCKVIKDTVISENAIITPPIMDKIYENMSQKDRTENKEDEKIDVNKALEDILNKARQEADVEKQNIIEEAKLESREILERVNAEIQALKEETIKDSKEYGYQEGYALGYKDGYDRGISEATDEANEIKEKAESIRLEAEQYLKDVKSVVEDFIKQKEEEIVKLSVNIAKQILNAELTINPDAINSMAEKILSKLVDKKQAIIKINPKDFNFIKKRKDELSIYVEDPSNLLIVADSAVSPGSIKAETPSGFIDGDIDSQLEIILKSLVGD